MSRTHQVTVCESHSEAGGAAHTFTRNGYHFESGPSLYSGMDARGKVRMGLDDTMLKGAWSNGRFTVAPWYS